MKKVIGIVLSYVLVAALAVTGTLWVTSTIRQDSKLDQLENLIEERFAEDTDRTVMEDAAADAMVRSLGDRWSYYIPAADYDAHMEQMNNAYVGIGITIVKEENAGLRIRQVEPEGPAREAGLLPGDLITAIDGNDTADMTTTDARNLVRGEAGTTVVLTVLREKETLDFTVTRRKIETQVASGQMLGGNIGLVTIANFDARCAKETIAAVEDLMDQGAEGLIFDVRFNPGGYADEMVKVLDYLLPEGDLFRTVNYAGKEKVDRSDGDCIDLPMAVLISADSYSAAEFFAATLREYDAAITVGEKTVGKGYYQNTFLLSDGSAVGLSTGKFFTSQGNNLEGVGIVPDVEVAVDQETAAAIYSGTLTPEEDPQLQAALEALRSGAEK